MLTSSISNNPKAFTMTHVFSNGAILLEIRDKEKEKDLFIGLQEFVVGYSKAPEQSQSSARPICHSHAMTRTGREPATICIAAQEFAALRTAPRETNITP